MEQFLECYLDASFENTPRNGLHDRRNRRQMVEYINTLIQGCAGVHNNNTELTCKEAITTLIRYHDKTKTANGAVCMMGKYHNILYVAVKLCYLWQLRDADLVCKLLREIYACESTFERILIGAIFGTKAPHFIAGWKSDFDNEEENVRGLVYFLDKANLGKLELPFLKEDQLLSYRFIDLPIESCGKAATLKICVQLGLPDKLLILLRFGALLGTNFEQILDRLLEYQHCYPYNLVAILQLFLRVVPAIPRDIILMEKYAVLIEDGLIPPTRWGHTAPELKHLCRCAIREQLWKNFNLPNGIRKLHLPEKMWRYLDLLED
ncbi:unnamed protein product [Ceutorhynchus assimilis]|uniref:SOCS box domain-containing protein n=1 Tax=Ceutorhynchus assimilis TaxID=467358 RepID=A0A9N9QLT1_9CUCU|nr:unnamed protein product [Ceutorhynchus assimilis]